MLERPALENYLVYTQHNHCVHSYHPLTFDILPLQIVAELFHCLGIMKSGQISKPRRFSWNLSPTTGKECVHTSRGFDGDGHRFFAKYINDVTSCRGANELREKS
jgi:hypothetical protein